MCLITQRCRAIPTNYTLLRIFFFLYVNDGGYRALTGDLYEGLLEKNANEKKSGAGQYFTPRALIESIVHVTRPQPGEVIQDPAAGTGGFLTHADRYMKERSDDYFDLSEARQKFQKRNAFHAVELVDDCLLYTSPSPRDRG